jgi:hypothetical protein
MLCRSGVVCVWWCRQPYAPAGCPLPPGRFLILISVRGWVEPWAIVRLEELGQLKKIHLTGTRTRDLSACSIVPQPTTLPCAPLHNSSSLNSILGHIMYVAADMLYIRCLLSSPWRWRKYVSLIHRLTNTRLYGDISRDTVLFSHRCLNLKLNKIAFLSVICPMLLGKLFNNPLCIICN